MGLLPPRGIPPSGFRPLRKIPHYCLPLLHHLEEWKAFQKEGMTGRIKGFCVREISFYREFKPVLSSDCRLQLACMKPESLVIAGQPTAVNSFPGLVHTARHTMGAGHARSRYLNREKGVALQKDLYNITTFIYKLKRKKIKANKFIVLEVLSLWILVTYYFTIVYTFCKFDNLYLNF